MRSGCPGWTGAAPRRPRPPSTPAKCGPSPAGNEEAMDPRTRRELQRYGAPAAFLLAATIAVLLIKAGLDNGGANTTTPALATSSPTTTQPATTPKLALTQSTPGTTTQTTTPGAPYSVIPSGDTLRSLAAQHNPPG